MVFMPRAFLNHCYEARGHRYIALKMSKRYLIKNSREKCLEEPFALNGLLRVNILKIADNRPFCIEKRECR